MSQELTHKINCSKCKAERDSKGEESKGDLFHIRIIEGKVWRTQERVLEITCAKCGNVKKVRFLGVETK